MTEVYPKMPKNLEIDMGEGKTVRIEFDAPVDWGVGDELLIRQLGNGFEIENTRTGECVPVVMDDGKICACGVPCDSTGYCDDCFGG